ncbi:polysaccharide biosynthesis protein, partial [Anaerotruncus colihominis]|uniref:polysaccharide biosynthesis protein n=1 Tax=Anaerotruncus colihominis TaxID=169435 RepID=UPI003AB357FB
IKEIRIFSRDEKKQDDMRHRLQNSKVKFYIGNVRNKTSLDIAMRGVDYVFAAAAIEQLRVLAEQIDVPMYSEPDSKNPVAIAQNAIQEAKAIFS